jgi:broad specificity phosphatase PhoE
MSAGAVRLFLVRHGEVAANTEMRYLGARDDPLTAEGRRQARCLAALFRDLEIDAVLTSPLIRARHTAHAIAAPKGLPVRLDERLREQGFGEWEGLTRAEVKAADPASLARWERDPACAPPDGESLVAVRNRVRALAREAAAQRPGQALVLVSHVGPIKALLCSALGVPLRHARRMFLDPATVSVVDWGRRPLLRLFNAHGHLGWGRARWLQPASVSGARLTPG